MNDNNSPRWYDGLDGPGPEGPRHWNGQEELVYGNADTGIICPYINPDHPMRWSPASIAEAITYTQISTYVICQDHYGKHTQFSLDLEKEMAEYDSDTDS